MTTPVREATLHALKEMALHELHEAQGLIEQMNMTLARQALDKAVRTVRFMEEIKHSI